MVPDRTPADLDFARHLTAARAGDPEALTQILRSTESRLRQYVAARLGPKLRTSLRHSDVLQNAYLEMVEALPGFEGRTPDDFVAWVGRIVENDIHRQHRHFTAQKRMRPRTTERNVLAAILFDPPPTPSREAVGKEDQELVRAALGRLDPLHAQVIQLVMLDQLPHKEVAERLQRSEGACRMLLMRARAALALELEHLDPGRRPEP